VYCEDFSQPLSISFADILLRADYFCKLLFVLVDNKPRLYKMPLL